MASQALIKRIEELERSIRPPQRILFGVSGTDESVEEAANRVRAEHPAVVESYEEDIYVIVKI